MQYRVMDALSHVRHNLHRLNEVIPFYFDDLQKALFGKRFITRWAPVHTLGIEYIHGGEKSVLAALMDRLISNPGAVYEGDNETELPLSDVAMNYGSTYSSTPRTEAMIMAALVDVPSTIYASVGVSPESSLDAHVRRCKEVFTLLLDHGFDPYKECSRHERHGRAASFVRRWNRERRGYEFCREMFAAIESAEAKKRGAHLDEVLPPVIVQEAAATPKRARL